MLELKYRILSIGRDTGLKTDLRSIFVAEGFEYDMVPSAEVGYAKLRKQHYDLIVSEINLEQNGMSGLDLLRQLRENKFDTPFIVVSDRDSVEASIKAINFGVAGCLVKPISVEETTDAIKRAIRLHKSRFLKNELVNYRMENVFRAIISSTEQSILKLLDTVDNLIDLLYPQEYGTFPDLKMAVYEGLSNAAKHGNKKRGEKRIFFKIALKMDRILVRIKDEGEGFDWSREFADSGATQTSHKGLGLIGHLADEVSFNIRGNEINMLKILE